MYNIFYFLFEFGAILTLFLILRREYKNKRLLETLILAFVYGLLLEIINTHTSQSYSYSDNFLLQVYGIPLSIAAGWAIIYYATCKAAEFYQLRWYQAPFFMALLAVMFDMILDPIAVRLQFWFWKIPMNQEWFGVPYDNLVGWMAVVWTFAFFMNLSERIGLGQFVIPTICQQAERRNPLGLLKGYVQAISHRLLTVRNDRLKIISKLFKYSIAIISPTLLSLQITIFVTLSAIFSGRFTFEEIFKFYQNRDFSYAYAPEVQVWKAFFFFLIFSALMIYSLKIIFAKKRVG